MNTRRWFRGGLSLALAAAMAGPAPADPGATTAGFLLVPVGARAVALGGAYTGFESDPFTLHFNPAALSGAKRQVVFAHNEYLLDLSQEYVGYAHPLPTGTLGLSVNYFNLGDFDRTIVSNTGAPNLPTSFAAQGRFGAANLAVTLGYARPVLGPGFHLGIAGKYLRQEIDAFHGQTGAADLGLFYRDPDLPVSVGLAVLNIGSGIRMRNQRDRLPTTLRFGAAYRAISDRLAFVGDVEKTVADDRYYGHAGAEWWVTPRLALRGGYDAASGRGNGLRLGAGVRLRGFALDYAWSDEAALAEAHRISLGYEF